MTAPTTDLGELLEKTTESDFLREMFGFTAQRLMDLEAETLTGAAHGSRPVISDAHVAKMLHATWQRCRMHTMRNLLAHAGRQGRRVAAAFIATAFVQNDAAAAKAQWRKVADQLRPKLAQLAGDSSAGGDEKSASVSAALGDRILHQHDVQPPRAMGAQFQRLLDIGRP